MRHTKIIATVGPASSATPTLDALVASGVDVFRLNFSHGTHDSHAAMFHAIRAAAQRAGRHIGILQDLSGPKMRTGALQNGAPIDLREGQELRIAAGEEVGSANRVFTPYAELIRSARPGDRLLLDDGLIELRVKDTSATELVTVVVNGGALGEHKGINAPGVALPSGALTAKDETDLRFGLQLGVDCVALSFVQTVDDIAAAKGVIAAAGASVPVVAKIERPQALAQLDAIVRLADGVMVARGDLGLECPLEEVPRVQKQIILTARAFGRPAIVATQVLESMRTEPRPTRAEVSDAATAVDQGADAIMLAGETAAGAYPVQAVQTLAAVICDAESVSATALAARFHDPGGTATQVTDLLLGSRHGLAMCEAAVTLAATGQAEAIVAMTQQGKTAQLLSALRPRASILAVTPTDTIARRLTLYWGVKPIVSAAQTVRELQGPIADAGRLSRDAVVVFISLSPDLSREDANYLNVQRLGL
jgi:pyruvate kinase